MMSWLVFAVVSALSASLSGVVAYRLRLRYHQDRGIPILIGLACGILMIPTILVTPATPRPSSLVNFIRMWTMITGMNIGLRRAINELSRHKKPAIDDLA